MPKPRTKRQAIRDERKKNRHDNQVANEQAKKSAKRQRLDEAGNANIPGEDDATFDDGAERQGPGGDSAPDREFFGMLSDQEQEYFRSVDEQLDIDEFPSQEERNMYVANVFIEAEGKEMKLACSQSCSRLMERLILMSNTRQKKKLFEQFGSHFLNLIQHRFASHCCETLLLQSAPIVTRELSGEPDETAPEEDDTETQALPSMEELFLLTLDELEGQLGYLLTDRFASHTLRVLLIILSGRPLEQSATKSLIHSKKKEKISVPWTSDIATELNKGLRAVPSSFTSAAKKIIVDSTSGMDATALRVLASHPTGNPVLQLLLELDIGLNSKGEAAKAEDTMAKEVSGEERLLWRLLPGAPASLKEVTSPANGFVNAMAYDPIGSRLLETLVTHCPGKLFRALFRFNFSDRIQSLVRNDIASYPAIRILNRLSKEDLVASIQKIVPEVPKLVSLSRFNVIKTLFERCEAREASSETTALLRALTSACGSDPKALIPRLCIPEPEDSEAAKVQQSFSKNRSALISHGSQLATTLLSIRGPPSNAIQASLLALPPELLLNLAMSSAPTAHVLTAAFSTPSQNKAFHKVLVACLMKDTMALALSEHGSKTLSSVVSIPSKSDGFNLPFHLKEQIMNVLGQHEQELRDSFEGRRVWRAWKGDIWKTRRTEWISWAKEVDAQPDQMDIPFWKKKGNALKRSNPNMVKVDEGARKRQRGEETATS
ncbi:pumilio-family RNA binding repeat domain-containing protein [Xylariales sp. AK1849]|nr:pumilio-family RNA binding repeat domain-containing protein [Xylariales sp. AK1849]